MLHGETAANNAELTAKNTFENKSIGMNLPTFNIKKKNIIKGIDIIDLVVISKISTSKSEIRRIIKNRGIRLNNKIVESEKTKISINDFNNDNLAKLSHGKKQHVIIKIN